MSTPKSPRAAALPPEPPELAAERERLMPELLKQAKTHTGSTQLVLRKLHDVLMATRPDAQVDFQVHNDAKAALEAFARDPVLPPPPIIMEVVEFLQKRAIAMGYSGTMQLPKGAPPPPPGVVNPSALPRTSSTNTPAVRGPKASSSPPSVPPRRATSDGFEMPAKGAVALNPAGGQPATARKDVKPEPPSKLKPGSGNVKG
jgi:hypothetical protein